MRGAAPAAGLALVARPLAAAADQAAPGGPVDIPASVWVPAVLGAAAAFILNQGAAYFARLRGRWNVAINVHREATAATILLPQFRDNLVEAVPRRLRAREPLVFLDDGGEGGVFKAFGDEFKTLPPSVAAASLLFFENYAFLSRILQKMESEAMAKMSLDRQLRLVADAAEAIEETVRSAHRTRVLCKLYLRGRYVGFLRTRPSAVLALRLRDCHRRIAARWRRADRRSDLPGLKLPARPWRPDLDGRQAP